MSITLKEVQVKAKELKIHSWWNIKKDILLAEVKHQMGIESKSEKEQEFLIRGGEVKQCKPQPTPHIPPPTYTSAMKAPLKKKGKKKTGETKPKVKKEKVKKEKDPNVVTLADICKEAGVSGRVARRRLRDKMKKPGSAWEWEKGDKQIKQAIKVIQGESK